MELYPEQRVLFDTTEHMKFYFSGNLPSPQKDVENEFAFLIKHNGEANRLVCLFHGRETMKILERATDINIKETK